MPFPRFFFWLVIIPAVFLVSSTTSQADQVWQAKVVKVWDGDTLAVRHQGRRIKVRLYGIDCPEHDQPWGQQAKAFTRRVLGQTVRLEIVSTDTHGRVVARVHRPQGGELGCELLRAGLAWWYFRHAAQEKDLARCWWQAVQARRGLWGDPQPQVPPWQWRRK